MAIFLSSKIRDLDGLPVNRILPHIKKRMVGPFIFLDHMGPMDVAADEALDVLPHPHIGLSTLTYLLEGEVMHRDSLGNEISIVPGDVNLMTAGKGIVHSEREPEGLRHRPHRLNGLQCWLALPEAIADMPPAFQHTPLSDLPTLKKDNTIITLIAGKAFGLHSPVTTYSPMFMVDIKAKAGSNLERPEPDAECLLYLLHGSVQSESVSYKQGALVLLENEHSFTASEDVHCLLFGGPEWENIPYIEWNFVSFQREEIEQAKQDWMTGRFPRVPGDSEEFTPLP